MIDFILHFDDQLIWLIQNYGVWVYAMVFIVIFCETGLVIAPFLPGDSLLFLLGAFAATGHLDLSLILAIITVAGILGDSTNYHIGKVMGPRIFRSENSRLFNKNYIHKTQEFYEKYGAKTLVIARFLPIIRTFAPFVAGVGSMNYRKFLFWNVTGALLWTFSFVIAGYIFGNIPFIKDNLTLLVLGIIAVSIIPALIGYLRNSRKDS